MSQYLLANSIFWITLQYLLVRSQANIYDTANFTDFDSEGFNHLIVHEVTGDVYIGGVNQLYRLNENLALIVNITTGPDYDDLDKAHDTFNKLLTMDYFHGDLITCGGYLGVCQQRHVQDLFVTYSPSALVYVAANSSDESTIGYIAPQYFLGQQMLYVGTTSTSSSRGNPFVSGRQLEGNQIFEVFEDGLGNTRIDVKQEYRSTFPVKYVAGFSYNGYSNFVTTQKSSVDTNAVYISKLVRVCQRAEQRYFNSYTEVTLRCRDDSYNLAQAAYLTRPAEDLSQLLTLDDNEEVLFVAFAVGENNLPTPTTNTDSAICMYRMSLLEIAFQEAAEGCSINDEPADKPEDHRYTASWLQGASCAETKLGFQPGVHECHAVNLYTYANGVDDQGGNEVGHYTDTLVTSIAVTTVQQHTVGFLGTDTGHILKLHFINNTYANKYEEIEFKYSKNQVLPDLEFDIHEQHFYRFTKESVNKVKVEVCSQYLTCGDYFESKDPYCGWCNLDRRCSTKANCTRSNETSRWLHLFDANMCVDIQSIDPEDGVPVTIDMKVTLNMIELPEEDDGNSYICNYDGYYNTSADKQGLKLTCDTPPINNRPAIPEGEDHVTIQLYVKSDETNVDFVNTDFHFYNCSVHKSCSDCTRSKWSCNWCVYANKCTHYLDNEGCPDDDYNSTVVGENNVFDISEIQNQTSCPQLDMQDGEVLIPVSLETEIHLETLNIYDKKNLGEYECVLMVEGEPQKITATRHNETSVTCNAREYTYKALVQEMNVTLTLKWHNDYIIDDMHEYTVTLYNCSINRRDCSECLSDITTRTPLQCGWCNSNSRRSCEIESHCESDWWAYGTLRNCDEPTVTKVWPLSGPHEGNTSIIIDGTDLGKQSSDIVSITVADLPCEHLGDIYTVSRRIECNTSSSSSPDVKGDVVVTVRANNGEDRTAKYSEQYTYRDPQVHDFTPKIGPESGGTIVSISGEYIDAGRIIEASFDGSSCLIDRMEDVLNETLVLCNTTSSNITDTAKLTMSFDGSERSAPEEKEFKYTEDPTVTRLDPEESMQSGGRTINVTGTHFKSIQEPFMLITTYKPFPSDEPCVVHTDTFMQCITPPVEFAQTRRKKRESNYTQVSVGFIMDAVESVRQLDLDFEVAVDPEYYPFADDDNIREHEGQVVIQGKDLSLASTSDEVYVTIGQEDCTVVSLSEVQLNCIAPEKQPPAVNKTGSPTDNDLPEVRVEVGNLDFYIGYLKYPVDKTSLPIEIIAGVAAAAGLLIIIIIILLVVFQRRVSDKDKAFNNLQKKADKFQQDVRDECKRAFTELQTDMSDVTKDVLDSGIPFLDFNTYAVNMMFAGQSDHPVLQRGAEITSGTHAGLEEFYSLLANKNFCLVFIRTLEEQKTMTVRDRVNVGSLLTIILQGEKKMSYLTDVLKVLLAEAAEEAEEDNRTKSMLRRTESIMEKMLTNWFVLTLYPFIKICAGEPIFMLFKAMKYQIDKGPMDAIEGLAKYSLTDKYLLRENYDPEMLTINVVTTEDGRSEAIARVLDVDTISQVKDKLLDVIYKNHAYSKRPSVEEIDLEWRGGRQGQGRIILQDDDVSSELIGQWKRLNTLKHYKVPDEAIMALVNRTEQANGGIRTPITPPSEYDFINFHNPDLPPDEAKEKEQPKAKDEEEGTGIKRWHLIKIKGVEKKRKNFRERAVTRAKSMYRPERVISEIFLLQLVTTKGTVQEFVQHVFDALLTLDKQQYPVFPPPVKHMFDFLDDLAKKHGGDDDDVAHIWKSNSLPLRIWANMLKCPNCVFDINASQTVVASLDIVAQTFIDACSKIERKLGVQSPAVKLLYAKELPVYKEMVDTYYNDIRKLPSVSDAELNSYLEQNFMELGGGRFNRMVALNELYKYATRFGDRILDALENDKECRQMNLAFQLEQVSATMAENEYQTHKALKEAKAAERPNSDISHTSEPSSSSTQGDDHQGAYEINQGFTMATENHTDNQQNSEYELTQLDQQQNENQNDGKPLLPQKSQQPGFSYGFALPKV